MQYREIHTGHIWSLYASGNGRANLFMKSVPDGQLKIRTITFDKLLDPGKYAIILTGKDENMEEDQDNE